MDEKAALASNWLTRARHDLMSAKKRSEELCECLDVAIYHCQQAGEKSVKGFLASHGQDILKTHDLRLLVQLAIRTNPGFLHYQEAAETLTPYATAFRYPGDVLEPTPEEMRDALENAEAIIVCRFTDRRQATQTRIKSGVAAAIGQPPFNRQRLNQPQRQNTQPLSARHPT